MVEFASNYFIIFTANSDKDANREEYSKYKK
jgi:hypothetical protein